MSALLDWFDARIAEHKALSADAYHQQELPHAEAMRAEVAAMEHALGWINANAANSVSGFGSKENRRRIYDWSRLINLPKEAP